MPPASPAPIVWVDVEHVPDFEWSDDLEANAAVVQGAARGYADAGYEVGVYSTPHLWRDVVGDLALGLPEWRAAGQTSQAEALARCGEDWQIQGGPAVLGQWVAGQRDLDVTCPGVDRPRRGGSGSTDGLLVARQGETYVVPPALTS